MSRICFVISAVVLAAAFPLLAAEPVQKVYGVADLVVPADSTAAGEEECDLPACCAQGGLWSMRFASPMKTDEAELIKLITSTVRPLCWAENGGQCSIEYFPIGMGLVVHAPDDVQKEVAGLLESLRKLQERQICFTLRFVTVSESFVERIGLDSCCPANKTVCTIGPDGLQRIGVDFQHPGCGTDHDCDCDQGGCPACKDCCAGKCYKSTVLSEENLRLFLDAVQGDRRANIMNAPRLTLLDGQTGHFSSQDRQQYVTGVHVKVVDGKQRIEPELTSHATGLKTTLTGKIAADGKNVAVDLDMSYTHNAGGEVPLMPVTYMVEPEFADGGKGPSVPFTQFIQQPKFETLTVDSHFNIPVGSTMVVDGGKFLATARVEHRVPVLSKVPYVNRLFKHVENVRECESMLVLITPTVMGEACEAGCCPPCTAGCGACPNCPAMFQGCPNCPADCVQRVTAASDRCGREVCLGGLVFSAAAKTCAVPLMPCTTTPAVESRTAKVAAKLVQKYHAACAAGHQDEAREFAQMALELDPMCFAKPCVAPATVPVTTTLPVMPPPMTPPQMCVPAMPVSAAPPQFYPAMPVPAGPPQYYPPMPYPVAPVQVAPPMPEPERHSRRVWRRLIDSLSFERTSPDPYYAALAREPMMGAAPVSGFMPAPQLPLETEPALRQQWDPVAITGVVPALRPAMAMDCPAPPQMIRAIQDDLNRRLPPRFATPPQN